MEFNDDYPQKSSTHDLDDEAVFEFEKAINAKRLFQIQAKDKKDYGVDVQIEAFKSTSSVTNIRVHIQVKGTEKEENNDGSVSVSLKRTNLNYLLNNPNSLYICYHKPSSRLLVRYALDVFREYERNHQDWNNQDNITVRFKDTFDDAFQNILHAHTVASGERERHIRQQWSSSPSEKLTEVLKGAPDINVPSIPDQAQVLLKELYDSNQDVIISKHFDLFLTVLPPDSMELSLLYMAEINLSVVYNSSDITISRIEAGILICKKELEANRFEQGSMLYCIGNGYLALEEYESARDYFNLALEKLTNTDASDITAMCFKNMGTTQEQLGNIETAKIFYEKALTYNNYLSEAHFALGLMYHRQLNAPEDALIHFDQVITNTHELSLFGWRAEILFMLGEDDSAYRDVQHLLGVRENHDWILPWCARLISNYGHSNIQAGFKAIWFWDLFLQHFTDDKHAQLQRLLSICFLKMSGVDTGISYWEFYDEISPLFNSDTPNEAYIWDRIGHYAQEDDNWDEAERAYRKAVGLEPEQYGYCLGVALNRLGEFEKALPILLKEAEEYRPDEYSWFQLARAYEGTGNFEKCIEAYRKVLEINPEDDLAWFNLGGMYLNQGDFNNAKMFWYSAIKIFPEHELVQDVLKIFPDLDKDV